MTERKRTLVFEKPNINTVESMHRHDYCLILAGGVGSRLWPVSRAEKPKQFLDLFGTGRTLLQQTFDRFARFMPTDHIFVSTHVDYLPLVYEQLPEVDDLHILEEPLRRGTLAAVAWGTVSIMHQDKDATIVVSPADQIIMDEEAFRDDTLHSLCFAREQQSICVMGIQATRAETQYGYIQKGEQTSDSDIWRVKSFIEKPTMDFARLFVKDGGWLWNTGLFAFDSGEMLRNIYSLVPDYQQTIPQMLMDADTTDDKFLPEFFSILPNRSVDLSVLERSENVYVHHCSFGWADMGAWETVGLQADACGNVLMGTDALMHNSRNNIVRLPRGRKAVIEGLTDYVVAEEGDVLLICPKNRQTVRRNQTDAQMELGVE